MVWASDASKSSSAQPHMVAKAASSSAVGTAPRSSSYNLAPPMPVRRSITGQTTAAWPCHARNQLSPDAIARATGWPLPHGIHCRVSLLSYLRLIRDLALWVSITAIRSHPAAHLPARLSCKVVMFDRRSHRRIGVRKSYFNLEFKLPLFAVLTPLGAPIGGILAVIPIFVENAAVRGSFSLAHFGKVCQFRVVVISRQKGPKTWNVLSP